VRLSGVDVVITDLVTSTSETVTTDDDGPWTIDDLDPEASRCCSRVC